MSKNRPITVCLLGLVALVALVLGPVAPSPLSMGGPELWAQEVPPTPASHLPPAYVYGKPDGPLAIPLLLVLQPTRWQGETNGLILMAGNSVLDLEPSVQEALRTVHAHRHPIVLTSAFQWHVDALNAILGVSRTVGLRKPHDHFDYYAHANSAFGPRIFEMMPLTPPNRETREHKRQRAQELLRWIELDVLQDSVGQPPGQAGTVRPAQTTDDCRTQECLEIFGVINAWQKKTQFPVNYEWGTCSGRNGQVQMTCTNNYQVFVNAWPVYSQTNAESGNGPTDFFIIQLQANLNASGCWDFYSGLSHDNRIAAYWARQYTFTAKTQDPFTFDDLAIDPAFNPKAANPSITVQTGTTWNVGGSGTVGVGPVGPTGSASFSAGVSYTDMTTATYTAMDTSPDIGSDANTAKWTYDSWNYVHPAIEPGNHACPSGLNTSLLPAELTNGTFAPQATYVWEASATVRNQYSGSSLPVNVDLGVLLGWVYYPNSVSQCGSSAGLYDIPANPPAHVTSSWGRNPSGGLVFDVSCATVTTYGTMPLGPNQGSQQDNANGNPGSPWVQSMPTAYIPFAPLPPSQ